MGGTGSGRLTPVQQWILGPSALFADVNGFAVDRLGVKHSGQHEEALAFLTGASWGFQTPQDLLDQADLLIQHGHRADFAQTARMTALPPAAREEFGDLLRRMDALVKGAAADSGSQGPDILRRLVVLRFGPAYAPLFDRLYSGDVPPHTTRTNTGPPDLDHPDAVYPDAVYPDAAHPDVGHPSAGQPGASGAGVDHPGMGQPGTDRPGVGQSGVDHPGIGHLGIGHPGIGQPGVGQPGVGQPGADGADIDRPGVGQPGVDHPGIGQPGMSSPDTGYPDVGHLGPGHSGVSHPETGYPNVGHPEAGYPGVGQPGAGYPPSEDPDFGQRLVAGIDDDISTTEMLEMRSFLNSVFTDPDYADEEPRRLEMWLDPTFPREPSRYMIWDYARVMLLLRCGHMADWLPEEFCWDRLFELAMDVQRHYTSWHDMATCYLQGRLMWSGGTAGQQDRFEQCAKALAADPDSPWNRVPWHLPLRRDWP